MPTRPRFVATGSVQKGKLECAKVQTYRVAYNRKNKHRDGNPECKHGKPGKELTAHNVR
ncbi:MAG: hypothetical protein AMXMBFR20_35930 [Planctomycetia bacterium]